MHDMACQRDSDSGLSPKHKQRLHTRFRRFQWHSFVNAIIGLVAGAASMVTATRWWGYVVLIPCIISLILCNYFWRYKLGYDRPIITQTHTNTQHLTPLLADLHYVSAIHNALSQSTAQILPRSLVNLDSLESLIAFITRNQMFEPFCEWLLDEDQSVFVHLVGDTPSVDAQGHITLSPKHFIRAQHSPSQTQEVSNSELDLTQLLLDRARGFVRAVGRKIFSYRERYLLELVGYAVWRDQTHSQASHSG